MNLYRPRFQPMQAWQYLRGGAMPPWVRRTTLYMDDDTLILDRPSGRQIVNEFDWLVRMDDCVIWFLPEEFEETFELNP